MNKTFHIALLATLLCSAKAYADERVYLGGFVGAHLFSDTLELGAFDTPEADSPRNSVAFGVRAGYQLIATMALEAELALEPGKTRKSGDDLTVIGWRLQARYDFLPDERMRPFAIAGGGFLTLAPSDPSVLEEDTDLSGHLGVGFEYDLSPEWALRSDARLLFSPTTAGEYLTTDFEFFLGAVRHFPRTARIANPDSDHDGVFDEDDQCPQALEDQDGYDDDDGCPDLDNDSDGVPDTQDQCPVEAESANGIDDEDGCPDADGDGDGIIGSEDLCPQEAEDIDGDHDEDGCPETDPVDVPSDAPTGDVPAGDVPAGDAPSASAP